MSNEVHSWEETKHLQLVQNQLNGLQQYDFQEIDQDPSLKSFQSLNLEVIRNSIQIENKQQEAAESFVQTPIQTTKFTSFLSSLKEQKSWSTGLIQRGYFIVLILAMLAIASGGVAFKKFPLEVQEKPLLISLWRYQTTTLVLLPVAFFQIWKMKPEERRALKDIKLWLLVFLGGITMCVWSGTWAVALNYTNLTSAYLLNNCQPLFLVISNKILGKYVNKLHVFGVFIGITGLVLVCIGNGLTNQMSFSKRELIGDGIALGGSIAAAIYISIGGRIRAKLPAFVYFAPSAAISSILFAILSVTIEHSKPVDFIDCFHTKYILIVLWMALVTGALGISLISVVMKYLPALVISIVLLFEPIAASIMAIIMKVEEVPKAWTWVGAALVTFGIFLVTLAYSQTKPLLWVKEKLHVKSPCADRIALRA